MEPEPQKEFNLCEIYSKLSDCPIHHKPFEFVCTSPQCLKSRLCCNKCLFDQTHNSCLSRMVLLDDILTPKCFKEPKESLRNWIPEEHWRNLADIQESLAIKNIDINLQEATCMLEAKWQQIEQEIKSKVADLLENIHIKIMEMFKQSSNSINLYKGFDSHFNPENLVEIFQVTPLKDLNKALNGFFGVSAEEFFMDASKKKNEDPGKGQEDHYMWLLAKLREKLGTQIKRMQIELEEDTERFRKDVGLKSTGLIAISRFDSYAESMQYGNQRCDCITFTVSQDTLCKGVSVYKSLKPNENWNMLVMMIQGEKTIGQVIKKQLFRVKNTEVQEATSTLFFDSPIEINAEKKYTLYVLINGPPSLKGMNGKLSVKDDNLLVKFFETIHSEKDPKNATGVNSGQIPAIIFSS